MSSEIFYDRAFIRIGEKQFIPIVNHGSSNCFDFDWRGRQIPEKYWSVLNYPHKEKVVFTAKELQEVAAAYEEGNMSNRGGYRKSMYRSFEVGEFGRWILGGMRSAHTVEEYTACGNTVLIIEMKEPRWTKVPVATTEQLLEKLEEFKGKSIMVSFSNDRHVFRPAVRAKKKVYDFSDAEEYYVLRSEKGYFVKRSSKNIWFIRCTEKSLGKARKFKTEKAAKKYVEDNKRFFGRFKVEIECVKKEQKKTA